MSETKTNGATSEECDVEAETEVEIAPETHVRVAEDQNENFKHGVRLRVTKKTGAIKDSLANVLIILSQDERWRGVIGYNEFSESPVLLREPPQRSEDAVARPAGSDWTEQDSTRTATWISKIYGPDVSSARVTEAMMAVAQQNVVHPVRRYLDSLSWDDTPRIDAFFNTYCHTTEEEAYAAGVARILFLSAVARIRYPGCKVDTMVILEGEQGIYKSSLIPALFGEWSSDTELPIGSKDAYQQLRGVWCVEIGELASFKGRSDSTLKSFISSKEDNYRPSYERRSRAVPRQNIFIGTTNKDHYLHDETGGRRFPPIKLLSIDIEAIRRDRDQLWAEADTRLRSGEGYHADKQLESRINEAAEQRYEGDAWEDPLLVWLQAPRKGGLFPAEPLSTDDGLTMAEIMEHALGIPVASQDKGAQFRVAKILHRAGWCRGNRQRENGKFTRRWRRKT